jgi:hypothetical protein
LEEHQRLTKESSKRRFRKKVGSSGKFNKVSVPTKAKLLHYFTLVA